jgi:membrane peptidoglycan carboxypeptidase
MLAVAGNDRLDLGRRPVAAKTGTVQSRFPGENNDAWMAGFTPQLAASVWMGTDRNSPIRTATGDPISGGSLPGEVWQGFMSTALRDAPVEPFAPFRPLGTPPSNAPPNAPPPTATPPPPAPTAARTAPSPDDADIADLEATGDGDLRDEAGRTGRRAGARADDEQGVDEAAPAPDAPAPEARIPVSGGRGATGTAEGAAAAVPAAEEGLAGGGPPP